MEKRGLEGQEDSVLFHFASCTGIQSLLLGVKLKFYQVAGEGSKGHTSVT